MSRDAASRETRRAVEATGMTRARFADYAKVDPATLGDFLDGKRWPQSPTRLKIEQALGWPAGRISDLADGLSFIADESGVSASVEKLLAAIDGASDLLPEARAHLKNQVGLLLRIQGGSHQATAAEQQAAETARHIALLESRRKPAKQAPTRRTPKRR